MGWGGGIFIFFENITTNFWDLLSEIGILAVLKSTIEVGGNFAKSRNYVWYYLKKTFGILASLCIFHTNFRLHIHEN